jgi:hypothetical protein
MQPIASCKHVTSRWNPPLRPASSRFRCASSCALRRAARCRFASAISAAARLFDPHPLLSLGAQPGLLGRDARALDGSLRLDLGEALALEGRALVGDALRFDRA